jgi:hypothetical protein
MSRVRIPLPRPKLSNRALSHRADVVRPDFNPEAPSDLFLTDVPLVLDQTHGLFEPFGRQHLIAANPDQAQARVPRTALADSVALRKGLHVGINGQQDRIICECCRANRVIWRSLSKRLAIENNEVTTI